MNIVYVDSNVALADMLERLAQSAVIAIDTEFVRERTFYPQVGLLQLCAGEEAWLVDPLKIDALDGLRDLMQRSDVIKVLHSGSEDLEVFDCWLGVKPQPLYDTQVAAAMLGLGFGLGYRALVEQELGIVVDKEETRSNWLARPLSDAQQHYAALDVVYLYRVYQQWQQRFAGSLRHQWILADGELAGTAAVPFDQYYRKVKSAWKLNRPQLAVLQQLCQWREQLAREQNKPRSWIIDDKTCLILAQALPDSVAALAAKTNLPASSVRRYGEQCIALIAAAKTRSESHWPEALAGPLPAHQRSQLKRLRREIERRAEALNMAPQVLFSSRDAERLIRQAHNGDSVEPSSWQGWRQDVVVSPLKTLLQQEMA